MSSVFEFNFSGSNYKVDKKSKEYKRLKELFPDCDFIFNLKKSPILMNDGNEYPSVLQFLAKGINEPVGQFIFEKPLNVEVYQLINKLTDGKWNIEIYIIKTYDSEGSTWNASGKITDEGIYWDISQNEDEEQKDEDSGSKLLSAAETGDTKTAKSLIDNGADIEETDDEGRTALIIAASEGHAETVELLIEKGADIESKDNNGFTALIFATHLGHTDTVKLLIEKDADIEAKEIDGGTALLHAAMQGHRETFEMLLDKGSDIEAKLNDGGTALILAAGKGHRETVQILLDKGADIESKDNNGFTALMQAAGLGKKETVALLIEKGADIEAKTNKGGTPLFVAVANGQLECVKMLIGAGANVNVKNKDGKTILIRAEEQGHTEIIKYLKTIATGRGSKESPSKNKASASKKDNQLKEPLKPLKLTIWTIAWEQEREDGTLILGGKEQKGYAIYENKADYNFIYDLTRKESVQNAVTDLVSGDLSHADDMESEGSENKGVYYYNAKEQESDDIDGFDGVGDTEVVKVETPYGYGEVVLELSDSTKIRSAIGKTGIEQDQCFNYFKKDKNGAKILKLLTDFHPEGLGIIDSAVRLLVDEYYDKGILFGGTNAEEAVKWYRKAAEQGHADAQHDLGYAYDRGKGVPENKKEAVKWYKKAADQGHVYAQVELGLAYSDGKGVPENKKEAAKWYRKAADQGNKHAQYFLGSAYSDGDGVPKDEKEAAKWYKKAADQGHDISQYFLGCAYYDGDGVPVDKEEGAKWHRKAADQGFAESQFFLGWAYENGKGVPKDNKEALKWYKLAAAQDYEEAQKAVKRLSGEKANKSKGK